MKFLLMTLFIVLSFNTLNAIESKKLEPFPLKELTYAEEKVIVHKGTERPFSGKYNKHTKEGVYTCKRCGAALYRSNSKFDSGCGWPSFDDEITGAVKRNPDADGYRVEIVCAACDAHLGHVFEGERFTEKNTRHCVNSISLNFKENAVLANEKKAYFAGGCFWGVEYHFERLEGVKSVVSGFMGGHIKNPSYRDVVSKKSGHLEVVEVTYDPSKVSYESLTKLFFEIHDPTQTDGQGPDRGPQYLSAIFTSDKKEKETIYKLVSILQDKGLDIATKIHQSAVFYKAEDYHQDYYEKTGKKPYCHSYKKLF